MPKPFQPPRFYPILDTQFFSPERLPAIKAAEAFLESGVKILQYRHKEQWTQDHFADAEAIADLCVRSGVMFILNDRADFAKILGCGVHVGQEDLPPVAARRVLDGGVMGFSTHNRTQLTRGNQEPVEYLSVGPIFSTTSKERPDPELGVEGLRSLRPITQKPVVAIGGITLENAEEVLQAGADSVAVISGLLPDIHNRESLTARARQWVKALG
jgi:thiamine-phosphate pyrophosphorylase